MAGKDKDCAGRYRVSPGKVFSLAKCDPRDTGTFADKEKTKAETQQNAEAIDTLPTLGRLLATRLPRPPATTT